MNHADIKYAKEIIRTLDECTWYLIEVSLCEGNPPHEALLYTGFTSGAYRVLISGAYENPLEIDDYPNAVIYIKQKMPTNKIHLLLGKVMITTEHANIISTAT